MSVQRVHYIATGGTIAGKRAAGAVGVVPQLDACDLIAMLQALPSNIGVTTEQYAQTSSSNLAFADVIEIAACAQRATSAGAVGVVISQGTDTIEETSFALGLLNKSQSPIVVTGAMRNPTLNSPDGAANILAALTTAASPKARSQRSLVVFNDEIHDPWFVRKGHTSNLATFTSGTATGPIGWISEGEIRLAHMPNPCPTIVPQDVPPPVAYVSCTLDDPLLYLAHLPSLGYRGLVLDAFGGGHLAARNMPVIRDLAAQIPVVFASRTGSGETLRQTYAFAGSEFDLQRAGCSSSGILTSRKARVVLALLLSENPQDPMARWAEFSERY